jgi:hypothetical protein
MPLVDCILIDTANEDGMIVIAVSCFELSVGHPRDDVFLHIFLLTQDTRRGVL